MQVRVSIICTAFDFTFNVQLESVSYIGWDDFVTALQCETLCDGPKPFVSTFFSKGIGNRI